MGFIFESDDENEEFEGFSQSDIGEIGSVGSDISLSDLESESSEDKEPELDNDIWTNNLYKPPVTEFLLPFGAAFNLEKKKKAIDFFHKFFPFSLVKN